MPKKNCAWGRIVTRGEEMQARLIPVEAVRLDDSRLLELYQRLGAVHAENVISNAMEDLAVRLAKVARAYEESDLETVGKTARSISAVALQVGMPALATAANNVHTLAQTDDSTALAATIARLARLGESSLLAIWDIQDVSG